MILIKAVEPSRLQGANIQWMDKLRAWRWVLQTPVTFRANKCIAIRGFLTANRGEEWVSPTACDLLTTNVARPHARGSNFYRQEKSFQGQPEHAAAGSEAPLSYIRCTTGVSSNNPVIASPPPPPPIPQQRSLLDVDRSVYPRPSRP